MHHKTTSLNKQFLRLLIFCFFACFFLPFNASTQAPVLRLTNSFNENSVLYDTDTISHTTWKPVLFIDSLYTKSNRSWLHRKFFEEHLLQVQEPNFNIFADMVIDEYIGVGKRGIPTSKRGDNKSKVLMMNTRGYEASGNIGDKFYFETALFENQGRFPGYIDSIIRRDTIIPFQNRFKNFGDGKGFDFSYSTASLIYRPNQHFLFNLGYGTNFIGDGYRSLLLSDYNTPYPYFRTALTFGKFQYSVMYSQYISETSRNIYAYGYPRKWGQTYLLNYQPTKNLSLGLFNSVISAYADETNSIALNMSSFSPVMFLHSNKSKAGVSNNDVAGLNVKYTAAQGVHLYGQFVADNFGKVEWENRYGYQVGLRVTNLFGVKGWNALGEFNNVRPYTYATDTVTTVFAHNSQPLAHPLGANFKEAIVVSDFSYKRWYIRAEAFANRYGADSTAETNFGQNVFKPLSLHSKETDIKSSQGLYTKLYYGDVKLAYIINKKTNLRVEGGAVYRNESNKRESYKDLYIYFGVRTTFRKLIYDF